MQPSNHAKVSASAPVAVQVAAVLMILIGLSAIIRGLVLLIVLVGVVPLALGVFLIWCAMGLFRLEKRAYDRALVANIIGVVLSMSGSLFSTVLIYGGTYSGIIPLIIIGILYNYRELFKN